MAIPTKYRTGGAGPLTNYDWTDVAEGTGIQQFYAGGVKTSAATTYILRGETFKTFYATNYVTTDSNSGGTPTKRIDLDFDLQPFNSPRTIKGTALAQIPVYNGGNGVQQYIIVRIRKWDGTTETEIASAQSPILTNSTLMYVVMPIVIPKTHFKIGEQLRMTVEGWGNIGSGTTGNFSIAFDPEGSAIDIPAKTEDFTAGSSIMKLNLPFRIVR